MTANIVQDATDAVDKAMKLVRPAMKGMPNRQAYMDTYDKARNKVAYLLLVVSDGEKHFDPDAKLRRKQQAAAKELNSNR